LVIRSKKQLRVVVEVVGKGGGDRGFSAGRDGSRLENHRRV
jgi:hypothetical protein